MTPDCPKQMHDGPCGGVRRDGSCEVDARPCPFLITPTISRRVDPAVGIDLRLDEPVILLDVRAPGRWSGDHDRLWRATATAVGGCVALVGEHVDNARLHDDTGALAPERVIDIFRSADVPVIATVTGRDRTVETASRAIGAFRDAGVTAVHCVTGDHPAALGIDRPAEFGAEAVSLVAACIAQGVPATVAESPASPGERPARLARKQAAGASMAILNHAGEVADLCAFVVASRDAGVVMPLIAPVPMVTNPSSISALAVFPGLALPRSFVDAIVRAGESDDAGLIAGEAFIEGVASTGHFAGINLSGPAGGPDPWRRLETTERFIALARRVFAATRREANGPFRDPSFRPTDP